MSFQTTKLYSLPNNYVLFDGIRIQAFSEDEAVSYEVQSDAIEHLVSSDGEVTIYPTSDNRVVATITLMETSASARFLDQRRREQHAALKAGILDAGTYLHRDATTGDVISGEAFILNRPTPDKAKAAGTREFTILLPYAADQIELAANL